jgi:mono/diheme cytochrome c family protein
MGGSGGPRSHLRVTAGFVLWLAAFAAVGAAFDGWLLAWSGGYRGALVTRHLWGGIALAALCVGAGWCRRSSTHRHPEGRISSRGYAVVIVALLGVLAWTSDQGGKLSHGDTFLTQYMPGRVKRWLGISAPPAPPPAVAAAGGPATVYSARIQPLFDHSCVSCHGPDKVKGGLRLDTYARLMRGGEDGPAVEPWLPAKSELVRRITLTSEDDDFMPSNNKNVLTAAEVRLIQQWIAAGASDREPLAALHP